MTESKQSKDWRDVTQISSLQAALNLGPTNQQESVAMRDPIRPPHRDDQGCMLFGSEEEPNVTRDAESNLVVATDAPKSRYAVHILRKQMLKMKEGNDNLTAMVQQLNLAVAQLLTNQNQMVVHRDRRSFGIQFNFPQILQVTVILWPYVSINFYLDAITYLFFRYVCQRSTWQYK